MSSAVREGHNPAAGSHSSHVACVSPSVTAATAMAGHVLCVKMTSTVTILHAQWSSKLPNEANQKSVEQHGVSQDQRLYENDDAA